MAGLSLAERRSLVARLATATPPSIEDLSRSLDVPLEVIRETASSWRFVIPSELPSEDELAAPPSTDREQLDNAVLALFRDDEALAEAAVRDPSVLGSALYGKLPDDFLFLVQAEDDIEIHRETPDRLAVVIPHPTRRFRLGADHELPDEMLDLVAGGGKYPCNTDDTRFAADAHNRAMDRGGNDP